MGTTIRNPLISLTLTFGAMLGLVGVTNGQNKSENLCELKVQNPHLSTYLFEFEKKIAIKTNAQVKCQSPQKTTKVWMELKEKNFFGDRLIVKYPPQTQDGTYSPYLLKFEGFFTECDKTISKHTYQTTVHAEVTLRTGRVEKHVEISNKSQPLDCLPSIKLKT